MILAVLPARVKSWNIKPDGTGLPFFPGERFKLEKRGEGYSLGVEVGPGIVNPSVIVVFDGESRAYAQCRKPDRMEPRGRCNLMLNDRGVQHSIPIGWVNRTNVKGILRLYRSLIGAPTPEAT
jgi:hypothetical protein